MSEKLDWDIVDRIPMGVWTIEVKVKLDDNGEVTINQTCYDEDDEVKDSDEVIVRKEMIKKINGAIVEREFNEEQ